MSKEEEVEVVIKVYFDDKYVGTANNMKDAVAGLKILTEGAMLLLHQADGELRAKYLFVQFTERLNSQDWKPLNLSVLPEGVPYRTNFSDDPQVVEVAKKEKDKEYLDRITKLSLAGLLDSDD